MCRRNRPKQQRDETNNINVTGSRHSCTGAFLAMGVRQASPQQYWKATPRSVAQPTRRHACVRHPTPTPSSLHRTHCDDAVQRLPSHVREVGVRGRKLARYHTYPTPHRHARPPHRRPPLNHRHSMSVQRMTRAAPSAAITPALWAQCTLWPKRKPHPPRL